MFAHSVMLCAGGEKPWKWPANASPPDEFGLRRHRQRESFSAKDANRRLQRAWNAYILYFSTVLFPLHFSNKLFFVPAHIF